MSSGNCLRQGLRGRKIALASTQATHRRAVRLHCLDTAGPPTQLSRSRVMQKALEQRLMVAPEGDEFCRERIAHQPIDYAARVGATVDIIADRDDKAVGYWMTRQIASDLADHAVEQVGAAMNVADDLQPTGGRA